MLRSPPNNVFFSPPVANRSLEVSRSAIPQTSSDPLYYRLLTLTIERLPRTASLTDTLQFHRLAIKAFQEEKYAMAYDYWELAKKGSPAFSAILGIMCDQGIGTQQNYVYARYYFEQGQAHGDTLADFMLALFYSDWKNDDLQIGHAFASQAASFTEIDPGSRAALVQSAKIEFRHLQLTIRSPRDIVDHYNLGLYYMTGHFVAQDPQKALKHFSYAAQRNYPAALCALGCLYYSGSVPYEKLNIPQALRTDAKEELDRVLATRYFEKAAQYGSLEAQHNLKILKRRRSDPQGSSQLNISAMAAHATGLGFAATPTGDRRSFSELFTPPRGNSLPAIALTSPSILQDVTHPARAPLNEVAQFIQDVYEGHKGVDPDQILVTINSNSMLSSQLHLDPLSPSIAPEVTQLHFLYLCVSQTHLLKHAKQVKSLFFQWVKQKFKIERIPLVGSAETDYVFYIIATLAEQFPDEAPEKSIPTTSMLATVLPLITDATGRTENDIFFTGQEIFEFLHVSPTIQKQPYVRLTGQFSGIVCLDLHEFDARGIIFDKKTQFYVENYDRIASGASRRLTTKEIFDQRLHVNFQRADLREAIIHGHNKLPDAFEGAKVQLARIDHHIALQRSPQSERHKGCIIS